MPPDAACWLVPVPEAGGLWLGAGGLSRPFGTGGSGLRRLPHPGMTGRER
jgi:hypothetical protein